MKLAFTVCSVSHLGQAKSMADSFMNHNPDYQLKIGIVDRIAGRIDESQFANYELIEVEKINIPNVHELCKKYDGIEMCSLTKPFFAEYFLNIYPELSQIIYVDTDLIFFDSVAYVEESLEESTIFLTPHILSPYSDTNLYPKETAYLNSGIYNSGFWAVSRSEITSNFLKWWKERLVVYGLINFYDGLFAEQNWLNYVPLFFKNVHVSHHLGMNVAYWNIHERQITQSEKGYEVNAEFPLIFFHYSGYKITDPTKISVHTNRFDLINRPELKPVFKVYHDDLIKNKQEDYLKFPNLILPQKDYMKWGILREYALRISRKLIRELHG
jgi:lipopolysaccharide biosynthesis glycosyltransferase